MSTDALAFWLGAALALFIIAAWCHYDGRGRWAGVAAYIGFACLTWVQFWPAIKAAT